jgi:hypothetical protein
MLTFSAIVPRLVSSYVCGRLVPFIGSGMSIPACVSWTTLVENLETAAGGKGEPGRLRNADSAQLIRIADAAVRTLQARTPGTFLREVENACLSRNPLEIPPQTRALAELWWPLVLTTNYDNLFEEAFRLRFPVPREEGAYAPQYSVVGRSPEDCQRVLNSLTVAGRALIWALQGYFDGPFECSNNSSLHSQIVIGHEHYRRVTYRDIHFRRAFAEVFRQRSLLFLGSGISETYLQELFGEVLELFGPSTRPHYALLPEGAADPEFLLSRFQITVATYKDQQHVAVPQSLKELKAAVECEKQKPAAWSWRPAETSASSTQDRGGLEIIRGHLPNRPPPGSGSCLAVSAGGSDSLFFFSPSIRSVLLGWGVEADEQPNAVGQEIGVYPKAPVYAVRARTPENKRALSQIFTATRCLFRSVGSKYSHIHMPLIATGSISEQNPTRGLRPFPPRFSLMEVVRAYAEWRREDPKAACSVSIYVLDPAVTRELASGRIDITELLICRDIRFWAEVLLDTGELERWLFQRAPDEQLGKVVDDIRLAPECWTVEVTPPPSFEAPEGRPLEPLLDHRLTDLGVVPGSTLHFRRSN